MLIKGLLLFITLSVVIFLIVTATEYFLWLSRSIRLILFIAFVVALLALLYRYVLTPLLYLYKIRTGLNAQDAAKLIGNHFPEVSDKLINLLDLADNEKNSDLVLAAIKQRSFELRSFRFVDAIDFAEAWRKAIYLVIPVVLLVFIMFSGKSSDFFGSYNRVVNFDVAFEPPAPFHFILGNASLKVLEDDELNIQVTTRGEVLPDEVYIETPEGLSLMKVLENGVFGFTVKPPVQDMSIRFISNGVRSRSYRVESLKVPVITDFSLKAVYPDYLKQQDKTFNGTGNAVVPEGTHLFWNINGLYTEKLLIAIDDSISQLYATDNGFKWDRVVYDSFTYELSTWNQNSQAHEVLRYTIDVVGDGYPVIKVNEQSDDTSKQKWLYKGTVNDDNGISEVRLVYYDKYDKSERREVLVKPTGNVAEFTYTFPTGIQIEEGKEYELYFEVVDNDAFRGGKVTKSEVFSTVILDEDQKEKKRLEEQEEIIQDLDERLKEYDYEEELLEEINDGRKEDRPLDFNEKENLQKFLQNQKSQEELMEKFSRELKENLEAGESDNEQKKLLKERLQRQELEAKKNKELAEELKKISDKIDKEELREKLEELAKKQKTGKRNLEQLLELTKRYYVTEKAAQISRRLNDLSERQKVLSKTDSINGGQKEEQKEIKDVFNKISEELNELKSDNRSLRRPMDLDISRSEQESVKKDIEKSLEDLNGEKDNQEGGTKSEGNPAKKSQSSAAKKMEELSKKLQKSMSGGGGGSTIVEDAEMLRQILDNLIIFSFKQESLMEQLEGDAADLGEFSGVIRNQKELRSLFEHVDDSLFALSLRRAELSEVVNEQIEEVYYNTDRALRSIADNELYQSVSYQHYVVNSSNVLADFLASLLDNMQESMMSGQGEGQGEGFQLPDLIKKQSDLKEKMNGSGEKSGNEGNEGEKESGTSENKGGDNGEEGSEGQKGKGQEGDNGTSGQDAQSGQNGGEGNNSGNGGNNGLSEGQLKEIYEIYQEQQSIRLGLEEQLKDMLNEGERNLSRSILLEMEQFENELLENGITERTVNRMNRIQQQLMRLENAALQQGMKKERKSSTNKEQFNNDIKMDNDVIKVKSREVEILNREALPLRPDFDKKVKLYFKSGAKL